MTSCHGFIRYTVEVFTIDEDQNESRGEKEIVIVAPLQEKLDVSTSTPDNQNIIPDKYKLYYIMATLRVRQYTRANMYNVNLELVNGSLRCQLISGSVYSAYAPKICITD